MFPKTVKATVLFNDLSIEGSYPQYDDLLGLIDTILVHTYELPENICLNTIQAILKDDGILYIYAEKGTRNNDNSRVSKDIHIKRSYKYSFYENCLYVALTFLFWIIKTFPICRCLRVMI